MKNRTKTVTAYADFPMRKLILGMMGLAVAAIFLSSFLRGPNLPQQRESAKTKTMSSEVISAVPELMSRVKDNPKDEKAILELAEIFSRVQDWQKSAHFWSKMVELNPKCLNARYQRGFALVQIERYDEAVADYEFIIQVKPDAFQALYYLGVINKYGYKNSEAAKKYFQQVLDMNPSDKDILAEIQKETSDLE